MQAQYQTGRNDSDSSKEEFQRTANPGERRRVYVELHGTTEQIEAFLDACLVQCQLKIVVLIRPSLSQPEWRDNS